MTAGQAPALTHPTNLSSRPMAMPRAVQCHAMLDIPAPAPPPSHLGAALFLPRLACQSNDVLRCVVRRHALPGGMGASQRGGKIGRSSRCLEMAPFCFADGQIWSSSSKMATPNNPRQRFGRFFAAVPLCVQKVEFLLMERQRRPNSRGGGGGPM